MAEIGQATQDSYVAALEDSLLGFAGMDNSQGDILEDTPVALPDGGGAHVAEEAPPARQAGVGRR